jgi:hypothetical protein
LDTSTIERRAAQAERARLAEVLSESARILCENGDPGWKAIDAFADELRASLAL